MKRKLATLADLPPELILGIFEDEIWTQSRELVGVPRPRGGNVWVEGKEDLRRSLYALSTLSRHLNAVCIPYLLNVMGLPAAMGSIHIDVALPENYPGKLFRSRPVKRFDTISALRLALFLRGSSIQHLSVSLKYGAYHTEPHRNLGLILAYDIGRISGVLKYINSVGKLTLNLGGYLKDLNPELVDKAVTCYHALQSLLLLAAKKATQLVVIGENPSRIVQLHSTQEGNSAGLVRKIFAKAFASSRAKATGVIGEVSQVDSALRGAGWEFKSVLPMSVLTAGPSLAPRCRVGTLSIRGTLLLSPPCLAFTIEMLRKGSVTRLELFDVRFPSRHVTTWDVVSPLLTRHAPRSLREVVIRQQLHYPFLSLAFLKDLPNLTLLSVDTPLSPSVPSLRSSVPAAKALTLLSLTHLVAPLYLIMKWLKRSAFLGIPRKQLRSLIVFLEPGLSDPTTEDAMLDLHNAYMTLHSGNVRDEKMFELSLVWRFHDTLQFLEDVESLISAPLRSNQHAKDFTLSVEWDQSKARELIPDPEINQTPFWIDSSRFQDAIVRFLNFGGAGWEKIRVEIKNRGTELNAFGLTKRPLLSRESHTVEKLRTRLSNSGEKEVVIFVDDKEY